jgi:hypothetical protein
MASSTVAPQHTSLDGSPVGCSLSVPMSVHTLGEAWKLGRRAIGCDTSADLDMKTLVWTRGEAFPLELLESRMRCPRCGSRKVTVLFEVPNQPKSAAGRVR